MEAEHSVVAVQAVPLPSTWIELQLPRPRDVDTALVGTSRWFVDATVLSALARPQKWGVGQSGRRRSPWFLQHDLLRDHVVAMA